jgi:hypothetical protein
MLYLCNPTERQLVVQGGNMFRIRAMTPILGQSKQLKKHETPRIHGLSLLNFKYITSIPYSIQVQSQLIASGPATTKVYVYNRLKTASCHSLIP